MISIHALLAESDHVNAANFHFSGISIHALLAESDGDIDLTDFNQAVFLSTLSLRRATHNVQIKFLLVPISIHALLAESDASKAFIG